MKYFEDYLRWLRSERCLSECTLTAYMKDVRVFVVFLTKHSPETQIKDVRASDIRSWVAALEKAQRARSSIKRGVAAVRSFYRFLSLVHGVRNNAALQVKVALGTQRVPQALSIDQMKKLLHSVDGEWQEKRTVALLALLYGTGMRISEALSLCWKDFTTGDTIRIRGKGGKMRLLTLLSFVREKICDWKIVNPASCADDQFVFIGDKLGALSPSVALKLLMRRGRMLAGVVRVTPHVIRHSFATHLLECGGDVRIIQELLGHASVVSTQRYMHAGLPHMRSVYARMHPRGGKR